MTEQPSRTPLEYRARTDQRQTALTEAFEKLLQEGVGLHALTIEAIAQRAGMSRSAFYFYFESKHDLLRAAVREVLQDMMFAANTFFDGTLGDPAEELGIGVRNVAMTWRKHDVVMRALVEGSASDPDLRQFLEEFVESFVQPVAARVSEVLDDGETDSAKRISCIAQGLLWMNERSFYNATVKGFGDEQWEALVDALSIIWRRALLRAND
ncbi:MAG: TetR/AcrR family transcriptional regulator [Polyangiales bacterium]